VAVALDDAGAAADTQFGGLEAIPGAGARELASRYVGYWEHSDHPVRRREVPGMGVTLILSMGPSMRVAGPVMDAPVVARPFVAGLHQGPAMTEHDGFQSGIQVDLRHWLPGRSWGWPCTTWPTGALTWKRSWARPPSA